MVEYFRDMPETAGQKAPPLLARGGNILTLSHSSPCSTRTRLSMVSHRHP
ncbi:hypothetical protein SEHO0A_04428 [Salmonella enterica subsp. houtenae str. ATCC BAA-1581]|nr:hypothetical protein SEHO0A_04428 [Salmonella enterica subsp. houtenae str. ATCC BAA-1581]